MPPCRQFLSTSHLVLLCLLLLVLLTAPPGLRAGKTKRPPPVTPPAPAAISDEADDQPADSAVEAQAPAASPAAAAPEFDAAAEDAAPALRGTTSDKAKKTSVKSSKAKAASSSSKSAKSKAGKKSTNGWLSEMADATVPYLLNIGTSNSTADVVADDKTQPAYRPHTSVEQGDTPDTLADVKDVADFFLWRRRTDAEAESDAAARSITMQRPVVFVQDADVLDAAVQSWGGRSVRLLPVAADGKEPITFSLVTSCKKAGTTSVNVALRSFEVTSGARSRREVEFSVKRTCSEKDIAEAAGEKEDDAADMYGEADDKKSAMKGKGAGKGAAAVDVSSSASQFDIDLIDADKRVYSVVTRGQAVAPFRLEQVKGSNNNSEAALEALHKVPATQSRVDLSIRYSGAVKRTLNKPLLYIAESSIVTVKENLKPKSTMLHDEERKFSLTFNCLAEGSSAFTVILTFKEEPRQRVSFAMEKECGGSERTEGVAGIAVDVATTIGAHDVVDDGITLKPYSAITKWDEANWAHKADIVPVELSASSFFITTTNADGYSYEQPVVTAFSEDGTVIAQPRVSGSVVTTDPLKLTADEPLELVLEYRCEADGVAGITVSLPLTDVGSVQFTVRKQCAKPTDDAVEQQKEADVVEKEEHEALGLSIDDNNQTTAIPGLNIGFSRTAHGQMYNGVVNSIYRLQSSTDALAYCPSNRQFLTFYLYQNASVPGAVDVAYGKAELIATTDISRPILSGSLEGGVVNASVHASFTVTFHCLADGVTMYTLTIPLLPVPPAIKPPRSAVVLNFMKNCNRSDAVLTVETGGVGIQGFRIGSTQGGNEVVHDGFPSIHYFGQKDRDDPNWNGIIVPESEVSSTFYLTYVGGSNIGEQTLSFAAPLLATHSSLVKPELSGGAAHGGQLVKNSAGLTLDITYNCRAAGLVPITVLLPIADGQIVFTVPKRCGGTVLPLGTYRKGLMVGVTEGGSEVVKDGLVSPGWAAGSNVIREDEDETRFWISMAEGVFQAVEPFVRAHRGIAQPTLDHDMYVSMGPGGELLQETADDEGNGEAEGDAGALLQALSDVAALRLNGSGLAEDEFDDVYINSRPAQLNVSYSCFDEGTTRVGITMPLVPEGYLEWFWTKRCPPAPWAGVASIVPAHSDTEFFGALFGGGGGAPEAGDDDGGGADGRIAGGDGNGWASNEVATPPSSEDDGRGSILPTPAGAARGDEVVDSADEVDSAVEGDQDPDLERDFFGDGGRGAMAADEVGGHHVNDPLEQHNDADSRDFARTSTLIVATSLRLAQASRGDVFQLDDGLRTKYKRPTSAAGLSSLAIIPADVDSTSFFVATSKAVQPISKPYAVVPREVRRVGIEPRVTLQGVADRGSEYKLELNRDDEPLEFVVEWRCSGTQGGVTPAIVSVPLVPREAGELRFYVGKMCPGDAAGGGGGGRSGRGWSLYVMLLLGVAASVGAMYYFGTKGGKEQLSALIAQGVNGVKRPADTLQRGEYEIVSQKAPRRRDQDGI